MSWIDVRPDGEEPMREYAIRKLYAYADDVWGWGTDDYDEIRCAVDLVLGARLEHEAMLAEARASEGEENERREAS